MRELNSQSADFQQRLDALLDRESEQDQAIRQRVFEIIAKVKQQGDAALLAYTEQFDGLAPSDAAHLEISQEELTASLQQLPAKEREALEQAAERIAEYHRHDVLTDWQYEAADGTILGQKISALQRVGLYVPGGKAAYPSSVLMTAIPAKVAGVKELIMTVPTPRGERNHSVLAAAALAGVDRVFTVGGAQAIAALSYGTATIPQVAKIVGPGNAYVAEAKRQVYGQVGIDMIAGPSEVAVVFDDSANLDWVAMDLFAQAEHDEMAQSIALTTEASLVPKLQEAIQRLLVQQPRRAIISESLANQGAIITVADQQSLVDTVDRIAPEHLELAHRDAVALAERISNAGAMFIGHYSAESLGDYCAGPSHVLPTAGTARFSSPLGVYDFQKRSSIIHASRAGGAVMARTAATLARMEGLEAHACAADYRILD